MRRLIASGVLACALLTGCVSAGTKVDPNVVGAFQPGITTVAEAEAKLGKPNNVMTDSGGGMIVIYAYTHAQASGSSYIPLVGPFVGHSDASTTTATLYFDHTGKFVRSTTSQGQTSAGMFNHG